MAARSGYLQVRPAAFTVPSTALNRALAVA